MELTKRSALGTNRNKPWLTVTWYMITGITIVLATIFFFFGLLINQKYFMVQSSIVSVSCIVSLLLASFTRTEQQKANEHIDIPAWTFIGISTLGYANYSFMHQLGIIDISTMTFAISQPFIRIAVVMTYLCTISQKD